MAIYIYIYIYVVCSVAGISHAFACVTVYRLEKPVISMSRYGGSSADPPVPAHRPAPVESGSGPGEC